MIKVLVSVLALSALLSTAALSKDVIVRLTPDEMRATLELIDAAVRVGGLRAAPNAVFLARKFEDAARASLIEPAKEIEVPADTTSQSEKSSGYRVSSLASGRPSAHKFVVKWNCGVGMAPPIICVGQIRSGTTWL